MQQGKITKYDSSSSSGIIEGDDGKEYGFLHSDWRSRKRPKVGRRVEFDTLGSNAQEVRVIKGGTAVDDEAEVTTGFADGEFGAVTDDPAPGLPLALRLPPATVFGGIFGLASLLGMFYAFANRMPEWVFCALLFVSTVGLALSSGGIATANSNIKVPAFLAMVANIFAWLGAMSAILMALGIIYSGVGGNPFGAPPIP